MTAHPVSPILLDRSQAWQVIDAQRLGLAGLLDDLSEHEWQQPSLCDGWIVRDVAAHLTLQQLGARAAIAMMLRYRGDTDRAIRECACQRAAALSTGQIIAAIRGMTGSRRHNFGVTYRETLIDILVHAQGHRHPPRPPPPHATRGRSCRRHPDMDHALAAAIPAQTHHAAVPDHRHRHRLGRWPRPADPGPDQRDPPAVRRAPCRLAAARR
jgi:hypothetical protein